MFVSIFVWKKEVKIPPTRRVLESYWPMSRSSSISSFADVLGFHFTSRVLKQVSFDDFLLYRRFPLVYYQLISNSSALCHYSHISSRLKRKTSRRQQSEDDTLSSTSFFSLFGFGFAQGFKPLAYFFLTAFRKMKTSF